MVEFLAVLLSGIMVGSIYGLVALGFVLIYKSSRVFNFAVGAMLMLSSYIAYSMMCEVKLPYWVAIPLVLLISAGIAVGLERFPLRQMLGQPILAIIMVTLALMSVFSGISIFFWGKGAVKGYPTDLIPAQPFYIGELVISQQRFWAFLSCMVILAILTVFFRYSKAGLNMRATAEGHKLAQSAGIKVNNVIRTAWIIAALVCAVGGIFLGIQRGVSLSLANIGLKAFPAALVGGLESLSGAIIGGIIIGVVEAFLSAYIGHGLGEIGAFIVVLLVLFIRPYGFFGLETIERL